MKLQFGILVGLFIVFLSLFPQIYLQAGRGDEYNGATFYYDYDEPFYAAYLQALIDGRPRKNSVYAGGDEPQVYETFLSVQFIPPLIAAVPARVFGLSSEGAFLLLSVTFAFFSALALYWLIYKITGTPSVAAVGSLFILIFGPNAAGISILKELFGFGASAFYLTFLRRYTPAIPFPVVFLLIGFVWLGLKSADSRERLFYGMLSVLCFAILVYSYFFFWTAILAWLCALAILNFAVFPENRNWRFWLLVIIGSLLALVPYLFLVGAQRPMADAAQVLEQTRRLVFLRPTIIAGVAVLAAAAVFIKVGRLRFREQTTVLIISLAVLPLIVFNQQVVTGHSLQPMHYNMYILNYLVLLGLLLLIDKVFTPRISAAKPIWLIIAAIICGVWGIVETHYAAANRYRYNVRRDEALPINRHLAAVGAENFAEAKSQITLNFDLVQADNQPSVAPQGLLWAEHLVFSNLSPPEYRQRTFLFLYFQNHGAEWLRQRLETCPNETCRALIGWRINPTLSYNLSKIDPAEIDSLVNAYAQFIQNPTATRILNPRISYVITASDVRHDLTNFEKWYTRDAGENFGRFTLYKVRVNTAPPR